jgi:hypothetical protein
LSVGALKPPAYEPLNEQFPSLYIKPNLGERCESFASEK